MKRISIIAAALLLSGAGIASAQDTYGAIAFTQDNGSWGWASSYSSQEAAESRALQECGARGSGCRVAAWFRNACGSLAVADGYGWGATWGEDPVAAERNALQECISYGNVNCRIEVTVCSDD